MATTGQHDSEAAWLQTGQGTGGMAREWAVVPPKQ